MKTKLKHLDVTDKEENFLCKVLIDIRSKGGLKEGPNTYKKAKDFPCKMIYYDIDNTLVLFENFFKNRKDIKTFDIKIKSKGKELMKLDVDIVPHRKHIKLLKDFHKAGKKVIAWSAAGAGWAEQVSTALGLNRYIYVYLDKPEFYVDDLESSEWMGERFWVKDE